MKALFLFQHGMMIELPIPMHECIQGRSALERCSRHKKSWRMFGNIRHSCRRCWIADVNADVNVDAESRLFHILEERGTDILFWVMVPFRMMEKEVGVHLHQLQMPCEAYPCQ